MVCAVVLCGNVPKIDRLHLHVKIKVIVQANIIKEFDLMTIFYPISKSISHLYLIRKANSEIFSFYSSLLSHFLILA